MNPQQIPAYVDLRRTEGIFSGSVVVCIALCFGALSEIRNIPYLQIPMIIMAVGVFAVGALSFTMARQNNARAHYLAQQVAAEQLEHKAPLSLGVAGHP
ncbi:MAG TPA: hypothetical protein VKB56_08910 [Terriglobales bacterium]|nr:hypothetical protein [Terriglobales bacterium]